MQDNNQMFLSLYSRLENELKNYYDNKYRGSVVIFHTEKLKKSYNMLDRERAKNLDSIRSLRNYIIHEPDIVNKDVFIVQDVVIDFLNEEIDRLNKPVKAIDICTKLDNLYYANSDSEIKPIIDIMIKKGYSHIPVLDKNQKLVGVFSANTLLGYVYNNDNASINSKSQIKDYIEYLDVNNHISEAYRFVKSLANIDEVSDIFEQRKYQNKRIVLLFVTKNGTPDDKIMGIITPYDVIKSV